MEVVVVGLLQLSPDGGHNAAVSLQATHVVVAVAVVDEIPRAVLVSLHQHAKRVVWGHVQCVFDPEMATFILIPLHRKHHRIKFSLESTSHQQSIVLCCCMSGLSRYYNVNTMHIAYVSNVWIS